MTLAETAPYLSLNILHSFFHRGSTRLFFCKFYLRADNNSYGENIIVNALSFHLKPKVFYPQSLALEVEGTGVVIQEMDPGAVNTEMTKVGPGGDGN